jgi:UDP-glucose-4-epimerase GalE
MRAFVTGGAGYVGSHAVRAMLRAGHEVVVFDNLSTGHHAAIPSGACFVRGDILEERDLERAFAGRPFDVLVHFAARAVVADSVAAPELYYRENVQGSLTLFSAARNAGVGGIVFSSSAAVYGAPRKIPIREDAEPRPRNPYGRTKLTAEQILADFASAYGLASVSFRYFNAAGAEAPGHDFEKMTGEDHDPETHLIPLVLGAARDGGSVKVFGMDYDTPDGTALRDYVHVVDIAEAHVLALGALESGVAKVYNLGAGRGVSVLDVVGTARRVTGREINTSPAARRPGDPPKLVASSERFREESGWQPQHSDLNNIIRTAWLWHLSHPNGHATPPKPVVV